MALTAPPPVPPADPPRAAPPTFRAPAKPLPTGRALLGGLLIALAALGVYASWLTATSTDPQRYVVATQTVNPGDRLDSSNLGYAEVDLPADMAAALFVDVAFIDGAIALGPVGPGEFLTRTLVLTDSGVGGDVTHELSFAVERDRALGDLADGGLKPGERIDVIATIRDGITMTTEVIAHDVLVIAVARPDDGFGARTFTISVGLPGLETAQDIVHAVDTGQITVVRATAAPSSEPVPEPAESESPATADSTGEARDEPAGATQDPQP